MPAENRICLGHRPLTFHVLLVTVVRVAPWDNCGRWCADLYSGVSLPIGVVLTLSGLLSMYMVPQYHDDYRNTAYTQKSADL